MSTATIVEQAVPGKNQRIRQARAPGGMDLGKEQSREAKRLAAAILEVLAGERTPTEAARALGLSVTRYYQVESRALRGLLVACEPAVKGRARSAFKEVTALRQDKERLQREVLRQQALVRAAQRSVGLTPPPPLPTPTGKSAGKKIRKQRVARALTVAARLQQTPDPVALTPVLPPTAE
jgi:hypothetical protein